jgi:5'-AMP-activated protein kinase regulatory beta subunit
MKQGKNGVWTKTVMLFPGRYEYKFMVDGQWQNDPGNDQACLNPFGTHNNVIVVSSR